MPGRATTALKLRAADVLDRARGRHDPLVPPRRLWGTVGQGDFAAVGDEFLGHLVALADLTPASDVLDVGCGIGRIARPLAGFLDHGTYAGFDVDRHAIDWCRAHYPADRFRFDVADLRNARYHPEGTQDARTFRFPYDDGSFDVAVITSVLTHLLEPEAEHYLAETLRVLRPGGRLLATFFLLDDASRSALRDGRAAVAFRDPDRPVAIADPEIPEEAVAYDLAWVRERLDVSAVEPGAWRGTPGRSYQDMVIASA